MKRMIFIFCFIIASSALADAKLPDYIFKDNYLEPEYRKFTKIFVEGAYQLIKDPKCPVISYADISAGQKGSSNPKFTYTCEPGGQPFNVFLTKSEIEAARDNFSRKSHVPTPVDEVYARKECMNSIKTQLNYPSTADFHLFGQNVRTAPNSNVIVTIDFDAKNGLGAELPYTGRCLITPDRQIETTISPRKNG